MGPRVDGLAAAQPGPATDAGSSPATPAPAPASAAASAPAASSTPDTAAPAAPAAPPGDAAAGSAAPGAGASSGAAPGAPTAATGASASSGLVSGLVDSVVPGTGQAVQSVTAPVLGGATPPSGPSGPSGGPPASTTAPPSGSPGAPSSSAPPSLLGDVLGTVNQATGLAAAPAQQASSGPPSGAAPSLAAGQPPSGGPTLLGLDGVLGPQPAAGTTAPTTVIGKTLNLALTLPVVEPIVTDVARPLLSSPLLRPVVAGLTWVVDALPAQLGLGPVLRDLGGVLGLPLAPGGSPAASGMGPGAGSGGASPPSTPPHRGPALIGHPSGGQTSGSLPEPPSPSLPASGGGGGVGAAFAAGNALVFGWAAMLAALLIVAGLRRLRAGAPRQLPRILFVSLTEQPG